MEKTKTKILGKFIHPDESCHSYDIIRYNEKLYAISCCLIIRTDYLEGEGNFKEMPEYLKKGVDAMDWNLCADFHPVTLKQMPSQCPSCVFGESAKICPECYGDGNHWFENEYNVYDIRCKYCKGKGRITRETHPSDDCPHCFYSGVRGRMYVTISGFTLCFMAVNLMRVMRFVPKPRFHATGYGKPVAFMSADYDYEGFIMPMLK